MAADSPTQRDITLYRQVDAILRDQIADGALRLGDRLPSEEALCAQFGISRGTVRQALEALDRDGLIARAPGRGTFVRAGARPARDDRIRTSWAGMIAAASAARRLQRTGAAVPPAVVTEALALAGDAETPFFIKLTPARAAHPIGVKRYLHPDLADRAAELAAAPDFWEALGGSVSAGPVWVEAILAEPRFAMQLKVPLGSPLLSLWWVDRRDGRVLACTQMLQPGAAVALAIPTGDADGL